MIQSMTGYCISELVWKLETGQSFKLSVELKSLNGRFFELGIRVPSTLMFLENQLSILFKQKLLRGKVFLAIKLLNDDVNLEKVSLNSGLVTSYLEIIKQIKTMTGVDSELKSFEWLSLPKVVTFDTELLTARDRSSFLELIKNPCLEALFSDRVREGQSITHDLETSLNQIEALQKTIFLANAKILENIRAKLDEQKKIWSNTEGSMDHEIIHEHKKVAELEFLLERSDISEEVSRSKMHVQSIKNMIASPSYEVGKKLEFTLQELLRETNTISSKTSNYEINSSCVDIKFELEKLREQSQNIA